MRGRVFFEKLELLRILSIIHLLFALFFCKVISDVSTAKAVQSGSTGVEKIVSIKI